MKLIVGLGNPGREYESTRHNVGFLFLDSILQKNKNSVSDWKVKFNGLYYQTTISSEKVIFLKPQSFMNLSGEVVRRFVDFFKISVDDILIVSDDLDLFFGSFKLKDKGSSGGHNGLKDIERCLGTSMYKRLKIGISNNKDVDTKDYVLGKFSKEEQENLNQLFQQLNDVILDYMEMDFISLMNRYNRKNR